jgi:hypothetical protein
VLFDPADLDGGSRDTVITSSVHWRLTYLYLLLQDLKYSLVDHWLHMFLVYTSVDIILYTVGHILFATSFLFLIYKNTFLWYCNLYACGSMYWCAAVVGGIFYEFMNWCAYLFFTVYAN